MINYLFKSYIVKLTFNILYIKSMPWEYLAIKSEDGIVKFWNLSKVMKQIKLTTKSLSIDRDISHQELNAKKFIKMIFSVKWL